MIKLKTNTKMQFKVPQDVQREDRIIGPITLRQLIILIAGGGIAYAIYITLAQLFYIEIWLPPVILIIIITAAFAFLKIHELPFHLYILNLIQYNLLPKKRVWKQGAGTTIIKKTEKKEKEKKIELKAGEKKERNLKELKKILNNK